MSRSSVVLETLTGFNEAVEVNNSNVVLFIGYYGDTGDTAYGALRLAEVENDVRYRRVPYADSALHGPFTGQSCGVGANLGPTKYTTALVNDTKFLNGELVLATDIPDDAFREIGVGVDNTGAAGSSYDAIYADTRLGTTKFNHSGTIWDSSRSVLTVQDGVYQLNLNINVTGGGSGMLRARLVGADGVEVLRCMDCLGSDGVATVGSGFTTWGAGSHTVTRMSGEYTLYLLINTTEPPTGFIAGINIAGITPVDPNAVFPSA